ncbi:MAG: Lrp/AsnC family transcriptional regulator [Candidatus Hydrogenedentota bacterium]|nr:MAG: Lrp/AsnC family transcriptional regulator [Candidatus Hydrogenedentota bacterium]
MDEILEILEKDARTTPEEIARMLGRNPADVKRAIRQFEKKGIILGYKAIINDELHKQAGSSVKALIEVSVSPEKDLGFDKVAERIYRYPEVKSCYLLSGAYDLLVVVEGPDLHTVTTFVHEKLAPLKNVNKTVTHFFLKTYKEDNVIMKGREDDKRIAISY